MAAWRAGFCPSPAGRTCPRMASSTSPASTFARDRAPLIAAAPSSWAGTFAKAPLNDPTAVRAADAITIDGWVTQKSPRLSLLRKDWQSLAPKSNDPASYFPHRPHVSFRSFCCAASRKRRAAQNTLSARFVWAYSSAGRGLSGGVWTGLGGKMAKNDGETIIRSEEHTSELQSLMRISYAVF